MSNEFDAIMNFDAFDAAEKITGASYSNDEATSALGMALFLNNNEAKKRELTARHDTHHTMTFAETCAVYEEHGFKTIYEETFTDTQEWSSGKPDTFKILWRDGVLITCESYYGGESTNSAKLYYNWIVNNAEEGLFQFISSGRCIQTESGDGISGYHDVREGFRHTLSKLEANGTFLNTWVDDAMIWLSNYSERDNFNENTARKIALLPEEIQESLKVAMLSKSNES